MPRITVLLDDIIILAGLSEKGEPRPAKASAICDLAGAGGVAIGLRNGDITPNNERIIKGIKGVLGIPLALIIPSDDKSIEKTIDMSPSMAVLADIVPGDSDYVARLQVANIIVAIEITPDLDQVKAAVKMKADYVAIDISQYCTENSLSVKVDLLNNIAKAAALAERLSMGVIVTGPMTLNDVAKLAEIEQVEDFFVGHELISKALLFGLEESIAEFKDEISGV